MMKIERMRIPAGGYYIPAIFIIPKDPSASVVLAHGYGGCKEEVLGIAWRIAEAGLRVCSIDLSGHGENPSDFGVGILDDMEAAIAYCRSFGKVAAVGHSLGGRLALISSADYAIGISPAAADCFRDQTYKVLKATRSYRVCNGSMSVLRSVLKDIPTWKPDNAGNTLVLFGSRDLPEISAFCRVLNSPKIEIENALHSDIFTLETTFRAVAEQLNVWFAK
ncbi:alpha/beta fold hydrolase [bacterium]|nr:alpha/beta fold hydrolase [bacterium]